MGAFKNLCQPIHLSLESIFMNVSFQLYMSYLEVGDTLLHAHAHLPAVRGTQLLQSAIEQIIRTLHSVPAEAELEV